MAGQGRGQGRIRDRGGFILIAALWLLVALGGVGVHGALRMQTERLATANALDEARAREAAVAGTEYARSRLTAAVFDLEEEIRAQVQASAPAGQRGPDRRSVVRTRDPGLDPWREPGGLVLPEMEFGDARFRLELRDVGAAINPNTFDEAAIRAFFSEGLELDYALADRITQAILDWRDEDDLPRIGGAEREEYLRAGRAVLPTNREFASVDELRHVMGMTPEILEAARPYLTLIPQVTRINVNSAPAPVLRALPGVSAAGAEEIIRLRESGFLPSRTAELLAALPASVAASIEAEAEAFGRRVGFVTLAVEIRAEGWVDGGPATSVVRTVVTRTNQGARVIWREFE
jgi:type II secretory pathway component PulK